VNQKEKEIPDKDSLVAVRADALRRNCEALLQSLGVSEEDARHWITTKDKGYAPAAFWFLLTSVF
jgi:uncharacterized protein YgfB (UPF0149 family)